MLRRHSRNFSFRGSQRLEGMGKRVDEEGKGDRKKSKGKRWVNGKMEERGEIGVRERG